MVYNKEMLHCHCDSSVVYAIWKAKEHRVSLRLNGTHQPLVYADDVNLLEGNTDAIKKSTAILIEATKEVGAEVNTQKTKYLLQSHQQNAGKNHDIKTANSL
jgi:hypothetical protein